MGSLFSNEPHSGNTAELNAESESCITQRKTDANLHVNRQGNLHGSSALTIVCLFLTMPLANNIYLCLCVGIAFYLPKLVSKALRGGRIGNRAGTHKGVVLL